MKQLPAILMGLLIGVAATLVIVSLYKPSTGNSMMNANSKTTGMMDSGDSMTMGEMVGGLQGKSGDDLDKAFIAEMIDHHQGAIDMAKVVQTKAKHEEVRKLANDIIDAQTSEIAQMREWQKQWGY